TNNGAPALTNCIVWGNSDNTGTGEIAQMGSSSVSTSFSCIQDGYPDDDYIYDGPGNIDDDPVFMDPDGPDHVIGTEDDDLRIAEGSPCIEAGTNLGIVPAVTKTMDGKIRIYDGDGTDAVTIDMGAYEYTCPPVLPPTPETSIPDNGNGTRNRYLSFVPGSPGQLTALRVTLSDVPGFEGQTMWVATPTEVTESSGSAGNSPPPTFFAARLTCEPVYLDWTTYGTVHVYDDEVVPSATYDIQAIHGDCNPDVEVDFSAALSVRTALWGDVVGDCGVVPCTSPDGTVDFTDVSAVVDKFSNLPNAITKSRADLSPDVPDLTVSFDDIGKATDAFTGDPYPFDGPQGCP
ncbi:MAG: hypothetical protein PVI86_17230, partial [Phycisphaerae bacterium]